MWLSLIIICYQRLMCVSVCEREHVCVPTLQCTLSGVSTGNCMSMCVLACVYSSLKFQVLFSLLSCIQTDTVSVPMNIKHI